MKDHIEYHPHGSVSFVGPSAVEIFRACAVESALRLYAKTGMKINRMYTPANMIAAATDITGKKFKARDYIGAADAIQAWRTDPKNIPPIIDDRAKAQPLGPPLTDGGPGDQRVK